MPALPNWLSRLFRLKGSGTASGAPQIDAGSLDVPEVPPTPQDLAAGLLEGLLAEQRENSITLRIKSRDVNLAPTLRAKLAGRAEESEFAEERLKAKLAQLREPVSP